MSYTVRLNERALLFNNVVRILLQTELIENAGQMPTKGFTSKCVRVVKMS